MTKRFGFTLAEVLITLGIIGVVAAMTIPTLISNTNGAQFKTGFKKALSTLNQAAIMNIAMEDFDFGSLAAEGSGKQGANADGSVNRSMSYVLKNRMQSATNSTTGYTFPTLTYTVENYTCTAADIAEGSGSVCEGKAANTVVDEQKTVTPDASWSLFTFADGTAFGYDGDAANCSSKSMNCIGFIDVNGSTNPNTAVTCTTGTEGAGDCVVSATGITDVFPVFFFGQTVEPASDAARAVLFGK